MEILLIDDNEGDRESVRRYLRQSSTTFTLTAVEDLAAGRAILENRDVTAILLDLGLAQTTGFQTINAFKDVFTTYPTIILTNNGNHVIGVQAVTLGAQDVLIKDKINPATLVQSIRFAVLRFEHYRTLQGMVGESKQLNQRLREVQRVAELASWSMDPLSYNMKWSEELFNLVGEKPHSFSPSRRDYLSYVPTDERDEVERFFTDALESIAPIELRHTVLVKNHQRIRVRVRAGAQFDPGANQIVLIGSVQQVKAAAISSLQRKQESTLKQRLLNLVIQGPRLDRPQLLQEIKALADQEGRRESMAETLPATSVYLLNFHPALARERSRQLEAELPKTFSVRIIAETDLATVDPEYQAAAIIVDGSRGGPPERSVLNPLQFSRGAYLLTDTPPAEATQWTILNGRFDMRQLAEELRK